MNKIVQDIFEEANLLGITQKELAKRSNVTESDVSHYINDHRCPKLDIVQRLANAIGCEIILVRKGDSYGRRKRID